MKTVFDVIAPSYLLEDEHWGCDLDVVVQAIHPFLPRFAYADLGCGPGFHVATIAHWFPEASVTGVDYSFAMLAEAEREVRCSGLRNVALVQANILGFKTIRRYHVVSCLNNTLGNVRACGKSSAAVREETTRAMHALLVSGGTLVASVYNLEKFSQRYGENFRVLPQSDVKRGELFVEYMPREVEPVQYYSHWFTESEFVRLLKQNGFKIELLEKRLARLVVIATAIQPL
ncbi:MAG: class I SAM-dependent methyltransferase [bacterium]|nr:class I SAM-dependent methyltransferase [bacterium]